MRILFTYNDTSFDKTMEIITAPGYSVSIN